MTVFLHERFHLFFAKINDWTRGFPAPGFFSFHACTYPTHEWHAYVGQHEACALQSMLVAVVAQMCNPPQTAGECMQVSLHCPQGCRPPIVRHYSPIICIPDDYYQPSHLFAKRFCGDDIF